MSGIQFRQENLFENEGTKTKELRICRLCLQQIINSPCGVLEGIKADMFSIILPELNLYSSLVTTICSTCDQTLQDAFNYKSSCLEVEERLQEYKECSLQTYVKLEDVISRTGVSGRISPTQCVCRTCLNVCKKDQCTSFAYDQEDPLKNMFDKCMPEVNLQVAGGPVICNSCLEVLENLFNFIMQCLDTEEKINYYCERNKQVDDIIDLQKVYLFLQDMECAGLQDNVKKAENLSLNSGINNFSVVDVSAKNNGVIVCNSTLESKSGGGALKIVNLLKNNKLGSSKNNIEFSDEIVISDSDSEDIQNQLTDTMDQTGSKSIVSKVLDVKAVDHQNKKIDSGLKVADNKNIVITGKIEDKKIGCESEDAEDDIIKLDELLQVKKVVKIINKPKIKVVNKKIDIKKETNPLKKMSKEELKEAVRVSKDATWKEPKSIYYEGDIDNGPVFKKKRRFACPKCKRKFKVKGYLMYHIKKMCKGEENTKDSPEAPPKSKVFCPRKCRMCEFYIDTIESMRSHLNVHRIHKCSNCPMTFIRKGSRERHQRGCILKIKTHKRRRVPQLNNLDKIVKKPTERKRLVIKPSAKPQVKELTKPVEKSTKDLNEPKTNKPDKIMPHVRYGSKQSYIFDRHKLTMYKCKLCPYQTRHQFNFNRHSKVHMKGSELKLYKCVKCSYQTVKQDVLEMHMRVHKTVDTNVRKCFLCDFTTSDEDVFQTHMMEHKSQS